MFTTGLCVYHHPTALVSNCLHDFIFLICLTIRRLWQQTSSLITLKSGTGKGNSWLQVTTSIQNTANTSTNFHVLWLYNKSMLNNYLQCCTIELEVEAIETIWGHKYWRTFTGQPMNSSLRVTNFLSAIHTTNLETHESSKAFLLTMLPLHKLERKYSSQFAEMK